MNEKTNEDSPLTLKDVFQSFSNKSNFLSAIEFLKFSKLFKIYPVSIPIKINSFVTLGQTPFGSVEKDYNEGFPVLADVYGSLYQRSAS